MTEKNQLYFGDNLDVLRRYVGDASVDLVYLDPPFNSNANYNVLFKEHDGAEAADAGFERTARPAQVKTIYGFKTDKIKVYDEYEVVPEW